MKDQTKGIQITENRIIVMNVKDRAKKTFIFSGKTKKECLRKSFDQIGISILLMEKQFRVWDADTADYIEPLK